LFAGGEAFSVFELMERLDLNGKVAESTFHSFKIVRFELAQLLGEAEDLSETEVYISALAVLKKAYAVTSRIDDRYPIMIIETETD
jgi:hypothetical protein